MIDWTNAESARAEYAHTMRFLVKSLASITVIQEPLNRPTVMHFMELYGYDLPEPIAGINTPTFCYQLINAAANQAGALKRLALVVLDCEASKAARDFRTEIDRLLPSEIFTLAERFIFVDNISCYIPSSEYSFYYRLARSEIPRADLVTAADLVDQLEQLPPRKNLCHPLIILVEKIAQKTEDKSIEAETRAWADLIARRIDDINPGQLAITEQKKLESLRQSAGSEPELAPERVTLVQVVEPSGDNHEVYLFSVLLCLDAAQPETIFSSKYPLALDEVRAKLITILKQTIEKLPRIDAVPTIELEFFLPRTLLHMEIENWGTRPAAAHLTLGGQYVVLLRDLDRWRDPTLWPAWRRKWRKLASNGAGPETSDARPYQQWVTCLDEPHQPGAFWRALPDQQVSLGLTFPPPPRAPRAELADALDAGLPVAFWPRRLCAHPAGFAPDAGQDCIGARFKEKVDARLAGRNLTDLPEIIREMRKEQDPQDASCPGFALLWDDPLHLPSPVDFHLDKPGDLGES